MTATRLHPARADVPAVWICQRCYSPVEDLVFCLECGGAWEVQRARREAEREAQSARAEARIVDIPDVGTCEICGLGVVNVDSVVAGETRCEACRAPRGTMAELFAEADEELGKDYRKIPDGLDWILRRHPALWWFASLNVDAQGWYLRDPFQSLLRDEFPKVTNAEWAVLCMGEARGQ